MTMPFISFLNKFRFQFFNALLFLLFSFLLYQTQVQLSNEKERFSKGPDLAYLPKGNFLKVSALGYETLLADLIWLKTVQAIGEGEWDYDWIYRALDVITTLDPKFDYVYQVGNVALAVLGDRPEEANRLLEKGLAPNPLVWQIPFYLGFNYFFYLQDFQPAAHYMAQAAKIPGRPEYIPFLASRLYVQAREPNVALEFLVHMREQTEDERAREKLDQRIRQVMIERDLNLLDHAIEEFTGKYGRDPHDLSQLVEVGLLKEVPKEPFGGQYKIESKSLKAKSTTQKERLRAYLNR